MTTNLSLILASFLLVLLNGFFVAAEFAIVKLRRTRADALESISGWRGTVLARVHRNLDAYLSACQLGITLASLGLGWIGEPAFADLLEPLFGQLGINSPQTVSTISFLIAFMTLSYLHIVVGDVLTVQSGMEKPQPTRTIPLNREARDTLKEWGDYTGRQGLVFKSAEGKQFDNVKKAWAGLLVNAGIEDFHWSDLRHHFASKLAMAGVALNSIQELLGHSDLRMTIRYSHLSPSHPREAVDLISP